MQRGNVAEAHQPFGMRSPFSKRNLVNQLNGAIAPTIANDGFDGSVVQRPADIAHALLYSASITAGVHLVSIGANHRFQSPTAQHLGSFLDVLHRRVVRRRDKSHTVARFQISRFHTVERHAIETRDIDDIVLFLARSKRDNSCKQQKC